MKTLHLVQNIKSLKESTINDVGDLLVEMKGLKSDGEGWCLYRKPTRGNPDIHYSNFYDCGNLCITRGGYANLNFDFSRQTELSREFSFYGPWMPGQNPDYSGILPVLFEIRDTINLMIMEGKESGESEEISGQMSSDGFGWFGTGTEISRPKEQYVTDREGRKRVVRHIELD